MIPEVIPSLVKFLYLNEHPLLQCESIGALVEFSYTNHSQHAQTVLDSGAIPIFIQLIDESKHHDVCLKVQ